MSKHKATPAGLAYFKAIMDNPGRGKNATKKRREAYMIFKKATDKRVRNKVEKK